MPLLFAGLLACSEAADSTASGDSGGPGVSGPSAAIAFEQSGTITLRPGELTTLSVTTLPAAPYEVSFYLLGNALDATLDRSTVVADENGRAEVILRAPNQGTTFSVRAVIKDGPSVQAVVSVSEEGFATLRVLPSYAGKRPVDTWVANVLAAATCWDIAASLPADPVGAIGKTVDAHNDISVEDVPVGPKVAVTLRAGHYLWGCADAPDLVAGKKVDVTVNVFDKPIDMAAAALGLELTWYPDPEPFQALIDATATAMVDTMFPPEKSESDAVLAALVARLPGVAQLDASEALASGVWSGLAADLFIANEVSLRELTLGWASEGSAAIVPSIAGQLHGAGNGQGTLSFDSFLGVPAESAGIPASHLFSWTADAEDKVLLAGSMFWMPSRFLGAQIADVCLDVPAGVDTVGKALDAALDCTVLAAALGALPTCDEACIADACQAGLEDLWQAALGASADDLAVGTLTVTAGGAAVVGDEAEPVAWSGPWLGVVSDGAHDAEVSGEASAKVNDPPQ